jgi:hypothetical protein
MSAQQLPADTIARLEAVAFDLAALHDDPDPVAAARLISDAGLAVLGAGRRRVSAAIDDQHVAKFAWRGEGLADNQVEELIWRRAPQELREVLCPVVIRTFQGALVMRRCVPLNSDTLSDRTWSPIQRMLARYGIVDTSVNVGVLEGRLVVYDYAMVRPELYRQLMNAPASDHAGPPRR